MFQLGLQSVSMPQVRPNTVALRQVDTKGERYHALRDSIKDVGFRGAITGRIMTDAVDGSPYIEVIDGLHRYTAVKELGLPTIKIDVIEANHREVLRYQILANAAKIETKPAEFARQIKRLMNDDPTITVKSLAAELKFTPQYIEQRLSLNSIGSDKIKELVDDGKIKLGNAYALAKLPEGEQEQWADAAITEAPEKFLADVNARVKALKEADKQGRIAEPPTFTATPHQRKWAVIKEELGVEGDPAKKGLALKKIVTPGMDPFEAARKTLEWVASLDADSVAEAKKAFETRQAKAAEDRKRAEENKNVDQAKKATRNLEKSQLEVELQTKMASGAITTEQRDAARKALKDKWAAEDAAAKPAQTETE